MDRSEEPPERSRAARRASRTRQRLLDAALATITARGYDGCSIEDITELADVGKGTFYRYFKDKAAVLRELLSLAVDDILARIGTPRERPASLDVALSSIIGAHAAGYAAAPTLFLLFLQGQNMAATRPTALPGLAQPMAQYFTELDKVLAPHLPPAVDDIKRRRLTCAVSACVCGFVTAAISGMRSGPEVAAGLKSVGPSFLAGVPAWLK